LTLTPVSLACIIQQDTDYTVVKLFQKPRPS
jgi:hypothetical protein